MAFTTQNTTGYSQVECDKLNAEFEARMTAEGVDRKTDEGANAGFGMKKRLPMRFRDADDLGAIWRGFGLAHHLKTSGAGSNTGPAAVQETRGPAGEAAGDPAFAALP